MHEGVCVGGPLDGQQAASRFPRGFLLVDRPAGECWLYDWRDDDGTFVVRAAEPLPVKEGPADGPADSRYRAAAEPFYDVLAAPWIGADEDQEAADGNPGQ